MRNLRLVALALTVLAACEAQPPADPVVVYAPAVDEDELSTWFAEFTADTDIPVTAVFAASDINADLVIRNEGAPPADLLISSDTAAIWRAADEGGLRPILSDRLIAVPAALRDPDNLWVASRYRKIVVAINPETGNLAEATFERLADVARKGQLCLLSPDHRASRALLAMLIQEFGNRPAERLVRGWVRALARPPFESESELLAAVSSGDCVYGFLSEATLDGVTKLQIKTTAYFDIDGVGIARHARNADAAQQFVEWLIGRQLTELTIDTVHSASQAGWRDEEARLLAERAGYR